jgi:phosphatidylglycerol:prolipoprotein diacylglycerol transferase
MQPIILALLGAAHHQVLAFQFASPGPTIGALPIRWYGLLIAIAVLVGVSLSQVLAQRRHVKPELISDLGVWLVIAAIPCARLYYVAFQWQEYAHDPLLVLQIWRGGIAIHGAILGGLIASVIFAKRNRISFWQLADLVAPSLILGQAIGRWGNFFNSEAFGSPTDLPWKLYIAPCLGNCVVTKLANNTCLIQGVIPNSQFTSLRPPGYECFEYFHPTFLYESLWNLLVFGILIALFRWGLSRPQALKVGTLFLVYLIGYGSGRIWIEGLRMDSLMVGPLRIAQFVSLVEVTIGLVGLWWVYQRDRPLPDIVPPTALETDSNENPYA